jgi:tRNA dimethylallyltransferase
MMSRGLLAEAENLASLRPLKALDTVGYRELFEYFDGLLSLDEAVDKIKQHSRNYAKRQMTWFRKYNGGDEKPGRSHLLLGLSFSAWS